MPQLIWLDAEQAPEFPDTRLVLSEPNGLLALGGALTVPWLTTAYQHGIFPWFSDGEPIMWWSPAPRMVMKPGTAHISRSLRKKYRRQPVRVTWNQCFSRVIEHCSDPSHRRDDGTWITEEMKLAYTELHRCGWAHSIEVWQEDNLIGGLYGLGMDQMFFGESMFSLQPDSSKFAFIALSEWTAYMQMKLIDCQLHNTYLESLGATLISRSEFERYLPTQRIRLDTPPTADLTHLLKARLGHSAS